MALQPVTDSVDSLDMLLQAQLFAQLLDMDIDRTGFPFIGIAPNHRQNLVPGKGDIHIADQKGEQVELLGGKVDIMT